MARETLKLWAYGNPDRPTVAVEYVSRPHWDGESRAYDVVVDGEIVGKIEAAIESTDRHYGRIRVPGKGRKAWSWRSAAGRSNAPGLYASNRRNAVAEILGYSSAEPV